jgi:apolipoprotein N-acyltransferase
MASRSNSRSSGVLLSILAFAATAVLGYLGTGLHPLWYVTWFVPLPVYMLAPRVSANRAFWVAFLAMAVANLNTWSYDRVVTPLAITIAILILPALLFAVVTLVFRRFAVRGEILRAAFSAPVLTVALEYLSEFKSPHSTFGNSGYTQMNFLPVLQIASIAGIWAIGFLLRLLPAAFAALLTPGSTLKSQSRVAVATCAIFALVMGFGFYRLHSDRLAPRVKVGLIVSDAVATLHPRGKDTLALVQAYASQIPALAAQGVEVIVLPEKIGRIQGADLLAADSIFEQTARENHVTILVNFEHQPNLHEARLYSPAGALEATYEKHHLLPRFESHLLPGTDRVVVQRPSGKWGIEICKDMDFPLLSRQYALDGAGLMLVPAWDFVDDGWLHGRMAVMRGVENGFSIARSVKQGILTLTDDRGRVLAEKESGEASVTPPFTILVGTIPVRNEPTFYARTGDWFAWLDIVLVFLLFIPASRSQGPNLGI